MFAAGRSIRTPPRCLRAATAASSRRLVLAQELPTAASSSQLPLWLTPQFTTPPVVDAMRWNATQVLCGANKCR
jgi:hypothetical protein